VELAVRLETAFRVTFDEARLTCDATVADLAATLELGSAPTPATRARTWPLSAPARLARGVLFSLFTTVVLRLLLGVRVRAARRLESVARRPVIYVANHQSHLDTPSILRALPVRDRSRVAVAAAHDHFFAGKRLRGFVGRLLLNMFPFVRQGGFRANLARVGRCLDAGYSVLVFPEGTRSRDGSMGRFKPGIGQIVREMGVPVVPLRVAGAHELLPPRGRIPRRGEVRVAVGPEIAFNGESPREIAGILEDEVRRMGAGSAAVAENGGQS
jgi:long-chain acyl-CoA synthetase